MSVSSPSSADHHAPDAAAHDGMVQPSTWLQKQGVVISTGVPVHNILRPCGECCTGSLLNNPFPGAYRFTGATPMCGPT